MSCSATLYVDYNLKAFFFCFCLRMYFLLNVAIMMCSEEINASIRLNGSMVRVKASCKNLTGKI